MTDNEKHQSLGLGAAGGHILRAGASAGINWVQKLAGIADALGATGGSGNGTCSGAKVLRLRVASRNGRHDRVGYGVDVGGTVHHLDVGNTGADVRLREVLLSGVGCR